jgi:hypothetical protein
MSSRRGFRVTNAPGSAATVQAAFAQVLGAFAEFFEWAYDVSMTAPQRQALDAEVVGGWSHPDQSVRQLVTYVLELHTIVFGKPPGGRSALRAGAQGMLGRAFARPEANGRGRVLALLQVLQQLRPGCTGVAPAPAAVAATVLLPPVATAAAPMADVPQFQQRIQDAQIRQQQILLENQIWNMQHDTIMKILR